MAGGEPAAAAAAAPLGPVIWLALLAAAIACLHWALRGAPPRWLQGPRGRARSFGAVVWVGLCAAFVAFSWAYQLAWGPYAPG